MLISGCCDANGSYDEGFFVTVASSERENSTRGAFSLSDKIVADKFRISLKEFTTH